MNWWNVPTLHVLVQLFVIVLSTRVMTAVVVVVVVITGWFGATAAEEVYLWKVAKCHGLCLLAHVRTLHRSRSD